VREVDEVLAVVRRDVLAADLGRVTLREGNGRAAAREIVNDVDAAILPDREGRIGGLVARHALVRHDRDVELEELAVVLVRLLGGRRLDAAHRDDLRVRALLRRRLGGVNRRGGEEEEGETEGEAREAWRLHKTES